VSNLHLYRQIVNCTISADQGIRFEMLRAELETAVVGSILCDPLKGMPIADVAGITAASFNHLDLGLIYGACDALRNAPLAEVLKLAQFGLKSHGYWNPLGPIGSTGCSWSDETLNAFAHSWFHSIPEIRQNSGRLIDLLSREQEIAELQDRIVDLITGDASPEPIKPARMQIVLRAPRPRSKEVA
jgi:hypothetical protein